MSRVRSRFARSRPFLAAVLVLSTVAVTWGQAPVFDQVSGFVYPFGSVDCLAALFEQHASFNSPNVGTGLNRAAYVIYWRDGGLSTEILTWGVSPMVDLGSFGAGGAIGWNGKLHRLLSPPSGVNVVDVTGLINQPIQHRHFFGVYTFAGVSQAAPNMGITLAGTASANGDQYTENALLGNANVVSFDAMYWGGNPTYSQPASLLSGQTLQMGTGSRPCDGYNAGSVSTSQPGGAGITPSFRYGTPQFQSFGSGNVNIVGGVPSAPASGGMLFLPLIGVGQ